MIVQCRCCEHHSSQANGSNDDCENKRLWKNESATVQRGEGKYLAKSLHQVTDGCFKASLQFLEGDDDNVLGVT